MTKLSDREIESFATDFDSITIPEDINYLRSAKWKDKNLTNPILEIILDSFSKNIPGSSSDSTMNFSVDIHDTSKFLSELESRLHNLIPNIELKDYMKIELFLHSVIEKYIKSNNEKTDIADKSSSSNNESSKKETNNQSDRLMRLLIHKILLLFKDQFNSGYVKLDFGNRIELVSLNSDKFKKYLALEYFKEFNSIIRTDSINNVVQTIQAKAELGDLQYNLSLRVAEYDGDIYYDLTDHENRCIRISKDGVWEILKETPIPLFRRYSQIPQTIPDDLLNIDDDPLEIFITKLTNINDAKTKLLVKVTILSYFVPNIPHVILNIHGNKGGAKTTLQKFIKEIVDPSKPMLLTLSEKKEEFIQQIAHNYLSTFDNMKYIPYWLSDEVCKAVTGIGQSKRTLYTNDDDTIYEYKHCVNFNGINSTFSEPDVVDRLIGCEVSDIKPKDRKTEKEIFDEFNALKPRLMNQIFNVLSKAIVLTPTIELDSKPRMADYALWGEAISIALGYEEDEFINTYYDNIGLMNNVVVESNPLSLAIRNWVSKCLLDPDTINKNCFFKQGKKSRNGSKLFDGTPVELLRELHDTALLGGIDTNQKSWPKDVNWLVRRLKALKGSLQDTLNIEIQISRDQGNNSQICIIKGNDEKSLEPGFVASKTSESDSSISMPEANPHSKHNISQELSKGKEKSKGGDTGDTGDKLQEIEESEPLIQEVKEMDDLSMLKTHTHSSVHLDDIGESE